MRGTRRGGRGGGGHAGGRGEKPMAACEAHDHQENADRAFADISETAHRWIPRLAAGSWERGWLLKVRNAAARLLGREPRAPRQPLPAAREEPQEEETRQRRE